MRISMRFLFVTVWVLTSLHAIENVTLDDALRIMRHNNIELSIAKLDEEIAMHEHEMANGNALGSLELTQSALRSNEALSVFGFKLQSREVTAADFDPKTLNDPKMHNYFETALHYTLPLYSGGHIEARQKITQTLKSLKRLDKEKLLSQKIFEVKKTFYTLSLLENHLKQLRIIASNTQKIEELSLALYNEGYAKNVDLLEVKARKSDIDRLIHHAHSNHTLLLNLLSFLLNEKVESIVSKEDDVALGDVNERTLLEKNIDIQKASKGVEISQTSVALSEAAFLPKVGAFARYASGDNDAFNAFKDKESYTIGLQMQWNLFHGGSDKSAFEKARVEHLKAQQQLSLSQKATLLQWQKINTEIENDTFAIESLKHEVSLAQAIYENYAGRYREKLVSIHEVLLKQSEELEKRLKLREVQNRRNEKIFEREIMIHKEES